MNASNNNDTTDDRIFVGISNGARMIDSSKGTIYNLARRGELKIYKVGNKSLLKVDELRNLGSGRAA
jgi:excisionase family DNA binding protein